MLLRLSLIALCACLSGCLSVHQEDLQSWAGRPVSELDKQPVFLTMKMVKTQASDGTEIRNYINGTSVSACESNGSSGYMSYDQYTSFTQCMSRFKACNNIFYIKGNIVEKYTPVGTGGGRCFTDPRVRPDFSGPTNL
jgi:hypothetical protein